MTLLPIVERELRIASRGLLTFWLRVIAASVAVIIGAGLMAIFLSIPGGGGFQPGGPLFSTLTWMAFATTLAAGVFFTSDCLSEEKREGTIGFLFLTDLRGYDVVFGKLIGTLCRCVFALMAIFPVLACALLFGGVEAGQFWRTILALLHALFFSLSAGIFVSSISRRSLKAFAGTIALMVILCGGGASLDSFLAWVNGRPVAPLLSLTSPVFVFVNAERWTPTFWQSLLASEIVAWLMLMAACVLIPRLWQEKGSRARHETSAFARWWKFGSAARQEKIRLALMDPNPTAWLMCRERGQSLLVWGVALFVVFWFLLASWWNENSLIRWLGWSGVNYTALFVFNLWVAAQASQFFAEARRGGLIELMLGTPLDFRKVAPGAWRGLLRMFGAPVLIVALVAFVSEIAKFDGAGFAGMPGKASSQWLPQWVLGLIVAGCGLVSTLVSFVALAWFGMWMGLTSRNGLMGTLKTVVLVQVVPWLVISFVAMMTMVGFTLLNMSKKTAWISNNWTEWLPTAITLLTAALWIGKDIAFYVAARQRMVDQIREVAVRAVAPVRRHQRVERQIKTTSSVVVPPVIGKRTE